jgi:hypothetical protein
VRLEAVGALGSNFDGSDGVTRSRLIRQRLNASPAAAIGAYGFSISFSRREETRSSKLSGDMKN